MAKMEPLHRDDDEYGTMLLVDIRDIFQESEQLFSEDVVTQLVGLEERPWSDYRKGKAMTQNALARLLRNYKITSQTIRIGSDTKKGYKRSNFDDAFNRYLTTLSANQSVTTSQACDDVASSQFGNRHKSEMLRFENQLQPSYDVGCDVVTDGSNLEEGRL